MSAESSEKNKHLYSRRPWTEMGRGNRTTVLSRASVKPRRASAFTSYYIASNSLAGEFYAVLFSSRTMF